jgi:hypothetical protein
MNVKDFMNSSVRDGRHGHHGLSREPASSVVLPVVLGLVCAGLVLGVLWLGYTFG